MKPLKLRQRITIVTVGPTETACCRAYVLADVHRDVVRVRAVGTRFGYNTILYTEEGVTWCRGWGGRPADALRVAVALAP